MPASSRKRNKGKDRKAKQRAKKEENERTRAHDFWWKLQHRNECSHGHQIVIPDDHPVSAFMDQFYINLHHKVMSVSNNLRAIFQTHTQIFSNEIHRKLVLDTLVHIGTNMMLSQGQYDIENAVFLEHFEHCNCQRSDCNDINFVINKWVVRKKWRDMQPELITNERDALKFYRKRTPCKCLKKLHLKARKTLPKLGICDNCNKEMERVLISLCSKCMVQQYCSRQCQVADWISHESKCG